MPCDLASFWCELEGITLTTSVIPLKHKNDTENFAEREPTRLETGA